MPSNLKRQLNRLQRRLPRLLPIERKRNGASPQILLQQQPRLPIDVTTTLLAVVSEKTGYPVEMLELDMGMDSDLGIDSIKRVEILSALQERLPGSPVIGPEHLGTLHTLGEIARHLGAGTAQTAAGGDTMQNVSANPPVATALNTDNVTATLLAVVSEKTGYPVEMLELDMGMDSDLGIDSIKRVEILSALQERLPGSPVIGPEHLGTLHTLGEIARHLGAGIAQTAAGGDTAQKVSTNPPAATALNTDNVTATLLAVVSEKTGYPVEMLELDMGMDSDLGIDSIKRVEILSALQERLPGSPVIGPEHLGTLHTLGEIARHLGAGTAQTATESEAVKCKDPLQCASAGTQQSAVTATVNRSAILPVDLGAATDKPTVAEEGEIWVTDDGSPFSKELCAILRAKGRAVRMVTTDKIEEQAPAMDIAGLVICAPLEGTSDLFLENAFMLLKSAAPALRRAGANGGSFFCTLSRLDGAFGFGTGTTLADPLSGGLAGLVKSAAREWPDVNCKAIDLAEFPDPASSALAVAEELFSSGPVEVGLSPQGRTGLALSDLPALTAPQTPPLKEGDVVVVTGGGRGVTTAAAVALAEAYRPLLVLLGRSPELLPEPAWLAPLTDEGLIKRAILEQSTEKLHPRDIEERYRTVVAGRELRATLARVEAAGGKAIYRSVDIRDTDAVQRAFGQYPW